ncbi:DUF748 domain-containing protein [Chitinilyticum piscinae]|uniref:DUF748 domain-containing protein n=1 Tax=Chitinilyticum piscinae TaxID=2866724 RepID=A0A8J7FJE7_9NEIS|nr:DUF748 domain-containing protein [Chitinilyticum piscinae]MBE9608622.1 DUF748 domain-containing protein [Chitinilyticum piscinae]
MKFSLFSRFNARRLRRLLLICVSFVLLLGIVGGGLLPWLVRPWLERELSSTLRRQVSIAELSFNPYLLRVQASDVRVLDRDGKPFVAIRGLGINAQLSSLWHQAPVISELSVDGLQVNIIRLGQGKFNFSDLLAPDTTPSSRQDAGPPRFSLNNIRIADASVALDDRVAGQRHALTKLQIALPFISSLPYRLDEYITPSVSGSIDGTAFALTGKSKPFAQGHETELELEVRQLDLTKYSGYMPLPEGYGQLAGLLSSKVQVVFRQTEAPAVLLRGSLQLERFSVGWQGQPLLQFGKLGVRLDELEPLRQRYAIGRIQLDDWRLNLLRGRNGQIGGQPVGEHQARAPSSPSSALNFKLGELVLNKGEVSWRDETTTQPFKLLLANLQASIAGVELGSGKPARVLLTGRSDASDDYRIEGQLRPESLDGELKVSIGGLQLARLQPYLAGFSRAELQGRVAAEAKLMLRNAMPEKVGDLAVELDGVALRLPHTRAPLFESGQLALQGGEVDLQQQLVRVAAVTGQGGGLAMQMGVDGQPRLDGLLVATERKGAAAKPWQFGLAALDLTGWRVQLADERLGKTPPLLLREIRLGVQDFDLHSGKPASMTFSALGSRRGSYKLAGTVVPFPFSGRFQLDLNGLDLAYAQPYFTRWLNVSLASGFVSAKGELQLVTHPSLRGSYRGMAQVSDFYALDKVSGDDFLRWKQLRLSGIDAQLDPPALKVGEILLGDFYSRLILSADGRLNLQDIVVQDGQAVSVTSENTAGKVVAQTAASQAAVASSASARVVPVSVGRLVFKRGNINYSDLFIKPNYTANMTDMTGQVVGLSTDLSARASLELNGSVDRIAPVTISGSLNPLAKNLFIDVKGSVKGYDLTAASTYSAKYAGYGIEKGKLSMDVAYFIDQGKLKASNKVFLDQLTLGEQVDSPDATKLPVKFALSLLTDRKGQINLNIPVEGSLDDPQFSMGGLIWQVIGNLLEKVVTAPFDALASAFGDGPQFSHVAFSPGSSSIDDAGRESIRRLADVLQDRPALRLDISGWAAPAEDAQGIRRNKLDEQIRALRVAELGEQAESLDATTLVISKADYPRLLEQVYKAGKFKKPKNLLGLSKSLPPAEMESLILANTVVRDDDLAELALRRAQATKSALKEAGVEDSRLFVVKSRIDASAADAKDGPPSRAHFKLQ